MPFLTDFATVKTRDGRHVVLLEPLVYVCRDGRRIKIPRGAQSDGASVPPALWPTLPPFGEWWKPAILHDAAYRNTALGEDGQPLNLPRETCDRLLLEAMEDAHVPLAQRMAIYNGVRLGGSWAFDEDRQ